MNDDDTATAFAAADVFTDRNIAGNVKQSVACLSAYLFPLCLLNRLTYELVFVRARVTTLPSSPAVDTQGHRSRSRVRVDI